MRGSCQITGTVIFLWKLILTSLEYFNVESSWKLRWCRDQDFNGSKIRATIEGLEL